MDGGPRPAPIIACAGAVSLGVALGIWVVLDPYATAALRVFLPLFFLGSHILALIPWELTAIAFALLGATALNLWVRRALRPSAASVFAVLFLVSMQTVAMHSVGPLDLSDVAVFGFVAWILLRRFQDDREVIIAPAVIWSVLLLTFEFLSVINGGLSALIGCSTLIKGILLALVLPNILRERHHIMFFLWTMISVTACSSVFAIVQEIVYLNTGVLLVGFALEEQSLKFLFEETSLGLFFRVTALNISYKHFSFLLTSSLLLALALYLYRPPSGKWARRLLLSGMAITLVALGLTFSTDAYLGLLAGLSLLLLARWRLLLVYGVPVAAAGLAVLVATDLGQDIISGIWSDIQWGEGRIRLQLARDGLYGFLNQDTWVGRGVNNSFKYTEHFLRWVVHNNIIAVAADIGVFGLLAFLIVIGQMAGRLAGECLRARDGETFAIALGMLAGVIAIMVSIQFHGLYVITVLWMYLGLTDAFLRTAVAPRDGPHDVGVESREGLRP